MNTPSDTVIAVENLSRSFRRKDALKQVTLHVPEGCVFGLVGENGAGKTTLIKHVLGALQPQQGRIRVFGKDPVCEGEAPFAGRAGAGGIIDSACAPAETPGT